MSDTRAGLRTVAEHRRIVLDLIARPLSVEVPVAEAHGLVLAADVVARGDLPGVDNSAMDGYAVRAAEVGGASATAPVTLAVAGDIPAGDTRAHILEPGSTMRIMTGAPMPAGADAVVPVEDTDGGVQAVAITATPAVGQHIRSRGEDIRAGETVLLAGTVLDPGRLALAAAANAPTVRVHRRARVAVVSTGDELVPPGSELARGQVVESNGIMLRALVEAAGADCVSRTHLPDEAGAVGRFFTDLPGDPDVVLTSGGVSMGAYDTVKEVLTRVGGVEFVKVAMRPGMPQGAGTLRDGQVAIVTLPGNPLSSLVSFHVFVLPLLHRLAGRNPERDRRFTVTAGTDWASVAGKTEFTRVVVAGGVATPSGGQGSHMVGALGAATGLAVIPPEVARVQAGDVLACIPLLGQDDPVAEEQHNPRLTHVDETGAARMVDVSAKAVTARQATAAGRVLLSPTVIGLLREGEVPKGDALAVARIAGIQAVKRTPDLIPLAHPIAVHGVVVDLRVDHDGVTIEATVRTADRTGIEMEALTAVAVAGLALIDMVKAVDRHARITDVRVTAKSGGRSGDWVEP